jgi:hypothetical protein
MEGVEGSKYDLLLRLVFQLPWHHASEGDGQLQNKRWDQGDGRVQKEK